MAKVSMYGCRRTGQRLRGGGVLTASTLLAMAERDGVRVGFSPTGCLTASGPREALAKWLPELRAMKPAIAAAVAQASDAAHRCGVCGQLAHFGFGVRVREGQEGRWFCAAHRLAREWDSMTTELDTVAPARSPSGAALRMRRHRERRRDGLRCMTIELRETEVSALIRKGFLKEDARSNLQAVRKRFLWLSGQDVGFVTRNRQPT